MFTAVYVSEININRLAARGNGNTFENTHTAKYFVHFSLYSMAAENLRHKTTNVIFFICFLLSAIGTLLISFNNVCVPLTRQRRFFRNLSTPPYERTSLRRSVLAPRWTVLSYLFDDKYKYKFTISSRNSCVPFVFLSWFTPFGQRCRLRTHAPHEFHK